MSLDTAQKLAVVTAASYLKYWIFAR